MNDSYGSVIHASDATRTTYRPQVVSGSGYDTKNIDYTNESIFL